MLTIERSCPKWAMATPRSHGMCLLEVHAPQLRSKEGSDRKDRAHEMGLRCHESSLQLVPSGHFSCLRDVMHKIQVVAGTTVQC
jgi:hypothetical protein